MLGAKGALRGPSGIQRHIEAAAFVDQTKASQALPDIFWNTTTDGLFALRIGAENQLAFEGANPAFRRMARLGEGDLAGKQPKDCLPRELAELLEGRCQLCAVTGVPLQHEEFANTLEGPRWRRLELTPANDPQTAGSYRVIGKLRECSTNSDPLQADDPAQRLLKQILDTSPDVIYVFDLIAGRNVFLNNRVCKVLGFPVAFLQNLETEGLLQLVHPDDLATVRRHMLKMLAVADGAIATAEFRCLTGHAGYRWFRIKETIFSRARDGRAEKVIGVLSDIDRLKKARIAFTEANERLKSILASISDCYLTIDRKCTITSANSAAAKWLGRTRGDIVGRKLSSVVAGAKAQALVSDAIRDRRVVHAEIPSQIHPGRWIDLRAYPSRQGVSVFFSDVTQRKLAEQAAARSDALLNASLDSLSVQIAILDKQGTIVACNEAWRCFVAGLRPGRHQANTGANLLNFYEGAGGKFSEARRIAQRVRAILQGRLKATRHVYSLHLGGSECWHQFAAASFTHAGDTFAVIAVEDVTDARHARRTVGELSERLLTLQEDERERLAGELHNSTAQHLAAIGLNAMLLRSRPTAPVENEHLWKDVEHSLESATRELRAFMYLLHPVRVGNDGFNATLRRFVGGFAARTGLKLALKLGPEVDELPAALQLSLLRIVQEVLVNAHVHTLATRFSITQTCTGGRVHLVIKDNGASHNGANRSGQADQRRLGVGLPAMRERMRRLGGNLEIRINRRGTRVDASVPCSAQPVAHRRRGFLEARASTSAIRGASRSRAPRQTRGQAPAKV